MLQNKNLIKICGIYKITCIANSNFYIGSSKNIYVRMYKHKSTLLHNIHSNPILQNYYNKYGEEFFEVELIEECLLENLLIKEQYYIDLLNPKINITKDVINNVIEPSVRIKMIEKSLKRKIENPIKYKYKKVYKFSKDLKLLEIFNSVYDAASSISTAKNANHKIRECCNGYAITYLGFYWSYTEILCVRENKKLIMDNYNIYQFTITGEFIKKWDSAKEIKKLLKIKSNNNNLSLCSRGRLFSYKGFKWSLTKNLVIRENKNETKLRITDIQKNIYTDYNSIQKASEITKIHRNTFQNYLKSNKVYKKIYKFERLP